MRARTLGWQIPAAMTAWLFFAPALGADTIVMKNGDFYEGLIQGISNGEVQVEINRALYLDEDTIAKKSSFASVQERLTRVMADLTSIDISDWYDVRLDALLAHETQVDPTSPFWFGLPRDVSRTVHPFDDANGRTTRLVTDWLLARHGYPPAIYPTAFDGFNALIDHDDRSRDPLGVMHSALTPV